ncbi:MAG: class D sortase [Clostridia bacterium]|nr:class D sortase [Clostridia bacterium]
MQIPTIELKANIAEGTTKEIMDKFIGHFKESKRWAGNVCLAAHNRGYENNYFENIKKLREGDKIIYYYQNSKKEYVVEKNYIIRDTDLSCLKDTNDNTITLITCIENEKHYRRCVKAVEKQK